MSNFTREAVKLARTLHIYVSLVGFLLFVFFAVTGILLNHDSFGFNIAQSTRAQLTIPAAALQPGTQAALVDHLRASLHLTLPVTHYVAQGDEVELTFTGPGRRTQVLVQRRERTAAVTTESRGWAGQLADLHKGADSGAVWRAILDATSILLAVSSISGVILLLSLTKRRRLGLIAAAAGTVAVALAYVVWVPR